MLLREEKQKRKIREITTCICGITKKTYHFQKRRDSGIHRGDPMGGHRGDPRGDLGIEAGRVSKKNVFLLTSVGF